MVISTYQWICKVGLISRDTKWIVTIIIVCICYWKLSVLTSPLKTLLLKCQYFEPVKNLGKWRAAKSSLTMCEIGNHMACYSKCCAKFIPHFKGSAFHSYRFKWPIYVIKMAYSLHKSNLLTLKMQNSGFIYFLNWQTLANVVKCN